MGMFGVIGYLPLYLQGVLDGAASQASLTLVVASLGWTVGSFVAGPGMTRFGYRAAAVAGMLLMALGYGAFAGAGYQLELFPVLAIGALIGVGMGIVSVTSMVAMQNGAPLNQLGVATSTVMLSRMLGGAFGITLMGSVLVGQMQRRLASLSAGPAAGLPSSLIQKLANPESLLDPALRALIPESMVAALVEILARSIWFAFLTGFFVMLLGVALSFFLASGAPGEAKEDRR